MRPKSKIFTPKRDNEHPRLFHMGVPPPPPLGVHPSFHNMKLLEVLTMYWHVTEKLLTYYRHITNCRPTVSRLLANCPPSLSWLLVVCQPAFSQQIADSWSPDSRQSANRFFGKLSFTLLLKYYRVLLGSMTSCETIAHNFPSFYCINFVILLQTDGC